MNKKIHIFLLLLLPFTNLFSQKKIYAYKQASLPGIQPNMLESRDIQEIKTKYNYWFFFILKRSKRINVTELWIDGNKFNSKSDTVKRLPVYKIAYTAASGNDSLTMVPYTKNSVLLINPDGVSNESNPNSNCLSHLIKSHELVITYYRNGNKHYKKVKKIVELEPEARM